MEEAQTDFWQILRLIRVAVLPALSVPKSYVMRVA